MKLFNPFYIPFIFFFQALQAPACHENMVKVGGYILGEFGNLIAGDQRSSPAVQFQLLHSKVSVKYSPQQAYICNPYDNLYITFCSIIYALL